MQNFDENGRKTPTFKKVILWQATTELRTAYTQALLSIAYSN
jgi:hypothetical protein